MLPPYLAHLPAPPAEALASSTQLRQHIRASIAASGGWISFARFMELALYAPGLGYYSAGSRKLGGDGDFVTAPELSPLFGRCLASHEIEGELPEQYLILELSADLRECQRERIATLAPQLARRVRWLDSLPE